MGLLTLNTFYRHAPHILSYMAIMPGLLYPEDRGTAVLRKVVKYPSDDTMQWPKRLES
jgi:uncharacterized membrane protein (UPF0182 family)